MAILSKFDATKGYKIAYYLRNQFENGHNSVFIDENNIDIIVNEFTPTTLTHKINKFLLYLAKKSDTIGKQIKITPKSDYTILGCKTFFELLHIFDYLTESKLITKSILDSNSDSIKLTFQGWAKIEEIDKLKIESNQAFVAMWFDKSMDNLYKNAIIPAIKESGYSPRKIDTKEHNNKICDEIILEIRRSKFLIADVTELRGGIYFEAGYAMGLGLPVIWTCRKDRIKKVHFDTRQYNHIIWEDEKDLYEKLKNRIQATIFVV
ncbi:MAG: nucleoside 2-deoxyribosyltransferase [Ignavibacteria bacterium]|nr:nucleoside 2-deoxyribosyltransferase [Ignavibacteria bacterium]